MSQDEPLPGSSSGMDTAITPGLPRQEAIDAARPHDEAAPFDDRFAALFHLHAPRLRRFLQRLTGEPDLAADLVQEAFVRLYARGGLPEAPGAWLATVALNLLRNARAMRARRLRLIARASHDGDVPPDGVRADDRLAAEVQRRAVRAALDALAVRDQQLLLLRAEGYGYRDLAVALSLKESSVGTLLARARRAFRTAYE